MSLFFLPNEPRIINPKQQALLTQRFLAPNAEQLFCLFTALRQQLDAPLQAKQPIKLSKSYPLGQCLEISQAMVQVLKQVDQNTQNQEERQGYQALVRFVQAGGEFRQVWGDLRGEYFQNAFILGSWYVDVANDTVNPNKASVEILPFHESGLRPILNFAHFAVIAKRYWQTVCLPNIVVPELAHHFPLIVLQSNAGPQLQGLFDYMIALTRRSAFHLSEEALLGLSFPEPLLQAFRDNGWASAKVPTTTSEAKQLAIKYCQQAREAKLHEDLSLRDRIIRQALQVNRTWQDLRVEFHGKS